MKANVGSFDRALRIIAGVVLSALHQSSLGTLIVVMGVQINPLWQTKMIPLLFLLSAIVIGYGVVLFEWRGAQ